MKFVVSGATGFLGGYALKALKATGADVIGTSRSVHDPSKGIIKADCTSMPEADVLLHFSECNNRSYVNQLGKQYVEEIRKQTSELVRKFPKIVYASTIAVYTEDKDYNRHPSEILQPFDTYSEAKLMAEDMILSASEKSVVGRIGNAFGPGMSPVNVISAILNQLQAGNQTIKLISADPVRDYIWCEDIARLFAIMASKNSPGKFHVARGEGRSVMDICMDLSCITGVKYKIVTEKDLPGNRIVMDINDTLRTFDWKPEVSVTEGLSILIQNLKL